MTLHHFSETTPAADRILRHCRSLTASRPADDCTELLLLCLLLDESLASGCLAEFGIHSGIIRAGILGSRLETALREHDGETAAVEECGSAPDSCTPAPLAAESADDPAMLRLLLDKAAVVARRMPGSEGISSEHLLLALTQSETPIAEQLAELGATHAAVQRYFGLEGDTVRGVIAVSEQLNLPDDSAPVPRATCFDASGVLRVLDANLNRAREGLRVLEDFARFIQNDSRVTSTLKRLRHQLVDAERLLRSGLPDGVIEKRSTAADVGTQISTEREMTRDSPADVVVANARRVQEALRSLEEFGKTVCPAFAQAIKRLRYEVYEAEKDLTTQQSHGSRPFAAEERILLARKQRLQTSLVYVLLTESLCRLPWKQTAGQILDAGVDIIQLREKHLNDRELLERCRWLRQACHAAKSLFIVNDRADIAALSQADGVHVGQEELTVPDVRNVLHPSQLVGVSTHNPDQARAAVAAGADYLGIGPILPSSTKAFDEFPGLNYLQQAASTVEIPSFAIGGISIANLGQITGAGGRRVAVSSAVVAAHSPGDVVRELRRQLAAVGDSISARGDERSRESGLTGS